LHDRSTVYSHIEPSRQTIRVYVTTHVQTLCNERKVHQSQHTSHGTDRKPKAQSTFLVKNII